MDSHNKDLTLPASWKSYLISSAKFLMTFYVATFCLIVFYMHRGNNWIISGIIIGLLYLFVIVVSLKLLIKKLPMAAIFLAAPIIPLFMLLLVITMIPLLQLLK